MGKGRTSPASQVAPAANPRLLLTKAVRGDFLHAQGSDVQPALDAGGRPELKEVPA